jgi:hypothetical protein
MRQTTKGLPYSVKEFTSVPKDLGKPSKGLRGRLLMLNSNGHFFSMKRCIFILWKIIQLIVPFEKEKKILQNIWMLCLSL